MGVFVKRNSMERILLAIFFPLNSKGEEVLFFLFTIKLDIVGGVI